MESRKMKPRRTRSAQAALALLALACCLTACQPTPTKPIVVNKNNGMLEEKIHSTPAPAATQALQAGPGEGGSQAPAASPSPSPPPAKLQDSFPGAEQTVTIRIDAEVYRPEGNIPVVEIKPRAISMEQVKAMASVLFQGNQAYEPKVGMSKEDLDKEILKLKKFISSDEAMLDYYQGNQEFVDSVKTEFKQRIAKYEEQRKTAPDSIPHKEADWTFHPLAYYTDMVIFGDVLGDDDEQTELLKKEYFNSDTIQLDADMEGFHARLEVMNLETDKDIRHNARFYLGSNLNGLNGPEWNKADEKPMTMTQDQAVAKVSEALTQIGLSNMRLSSCQPISKTLPANTAPADMSFSPEQAAVYEAAGEGGLDYSQNDNAIYGYYLSFVPTFEGVTAAATGRGVDISGKNPYGPSYGYDQLRVTVRNDMIISLQWDSPVEQVQVENPNVPMLPFEEIMAAFQKQMQLEYTLARLSRYSPENNDYKEYIATLESGEITIKRVSLALVRLFIQDRPGAYRMVPAWIFTGAEKLNAKAKRPAPAPLPGESLSDRLFTYMAINAIDGSIINPAEGY